MKMYDDSLTEWNFLKIEKQATEGLLFRGPHLRAECLKNKGFHFVQYETNYTKYINLPSFNCKKSHKHAINLREESNRRFKSNTPRFLFESKSLQIEHRSKSKLQRNVYRLTLSEKKKKKEKKSKWSRIARGAIRPTAWTVKTSARLEHKYFPMFNYIQFGVARVVQTTTPRVACLLWLFKGSKYIT